MVQDLSLHAQCSTPLLPSARAQRRCRHYGRAPCTAEPAGRWGSAKQSMALHSNAVLQRTVSGQVACASSMQAESSSPGSSTASEPRDDDVLPDSLGDALSKASAATCAAVSKGGVSRCLVEILLPAFWDPASGAVFSEEGDQQRFWKLTRRFIEDLAQAYPGEAPRVRALYPDIGVASMLKNQWGPDVAFQIAAVNDREPVAEDDELVVLAAPDPQSLDKVMRVVQALEGQRPVVLFNPRLASGDVGIGLNVRRMRDKFLGSFTTTYSLRPVGDDLGSVFRQWPEQWKVFVADAASPGRFRLAAERGARPAGDALDAILAEALGGGGGGEDGSGEGQGLLAQVGGTVASLQRFMRSLSQ